MKLFKNSVGRPSNELKFIRKLFIMSVISIILSSISLIISSILLLNGSFINKMEAKVKSKNNVTIKLAPNSSDSTDYTKSSGTFVDEIYYWKTTGKKTVTYEIKNNSNSSVYYGWFTYNGSKSSSPHYGGKASERGCDEVKAGSTATGSPTATIDATGDFKTRVVEIRVYKTKNECEADNSATKSTIVDANITYKFKADSSDASKDNNGSSVSILEALVNFFVTLFEKISLLFSGSGNETGTDNPPATPTATLKLFCPPHALVNKVFTCTTNMADATFTVTSDGLASGYSTSRKTSSSDLTKQSKYTNAGKTVEVKISKSGYETVTKKVEIVSSAKQATYVKNEYTLVVDNSGNYRSKGTQSSSSSSCNCYSKAYAEMIVNGSSNTSVSNCGSSVYGSEKCYSTSNSITAIFNDIRNEIKNGKPVAVNVETSGQHWILVIGIKTNSLTKEAVNLSYSDFLVADPLKSSEYNWQSLITSTGNRKFRVQGSSQPCSGKYRINK